MMQVVGEQHLVSACAAALGATGASDLPSLFKPALRRASYLLAPCSAADLVRFVRDPLSSLGADDDAVNGALDELIAYGEVLEMRKLDSDPWDAPSVILRPAPPSFVLRSPSEAIILGVAGELPSPLPAELSTRMVVEGPVRVLGGSLDERLADQLRLLGLVQLSEPQWLRLPAIVTAEAHVADWNERLTAASASSASSEGLDILDGDRPTRFYVGRWRSPSDRDTGRFLARRAQLYGAGVWSYVELAKGRVERFIDLADSGGTQHPRDLAWRLQAALDATQGRSQQVGVRTVGDRAHLDFVSPLPAFAERRLALVGTKVKTPGTLFRFEVATEAADAVIELLRSLLWMKPEPAGH